MTKHNITLYLDKCTHNVAERITVRRGETNTQDIVALIEDATYAAGTVCRLKVLHSDGTWALSNATWDGAVATTTLTSDVLNGKGKCRIAYFEFVVPHEDNEDEYDVETTTNFELLIIADVDINDKQARGYSDEFNKLYNTLIKLEPKLITAKNNAEIAADTALTAAKDVEVAIEKTNEATDNANIAAGNATTAAKRADEAASRVDETIDKCESAIDECTTATNDCKTTTDTCKESEAARVTAEEKRVTSENERVTAEEKRVADFAEMISKMHGLTVHICVDGEYDEETLTPTIAGEESVLYLTPNNTSNSTDSYFEWIYVNKTFERIGGTATTIEGISTDTIDAIANGETKSGSEVANTTVVSYIFAKLRALFAPLKHTHVKADITDLDLNNATINVVQGTKSIGSFTLNQASDETITIEEYEHPQKSGWYHIPTGGTTQQYLSWKSDGVATWSSPTSIVTKDDSSLITSAGVYTKLEEYAPLDSPALVGTPTTPTAVAGTSTTQIATCEFVSDAINTAITEVENGSY